MSLDKEHSELETRRLWNSLRIRIKGLKYLSLSSEPILGIRILWSNKQMHIKRRTSRHCQTQHGVRHQEALVDLEKRVQTFQ